MKFPKDAASNFKIGTMKKGQDGKMYRVVKGWVRVSKQGTISKRGRGARTKDAEMPDNVKVKVLQQAMELADEVPLSDRAAIRQGAVNFATASKNTMRLWNPQRFGSHKDVDLKEEAQKNIISRMIQENFQAMMTEQINEAHVPDADTLIHMQIVLSHWTKLMERAAASKQDAITKMQEVKELWKALNENNKGKMKPHPELNVEATKQEYKKAVDNKGGSVKLVLKL